VQLRSYKVRIADRHARIVPAQDEKGCPFQGPGVDLRGEEAERAIEAAAALIKVLMSFEPGIVVRSLSLDLERPRLLVTLDPLTPDKDMRPRVVRIDGGPALEAILEASGPLTNMLTDAARRALARRNRREGER
jgi:hypothetical protein